MDKYKRLVSNTMLFAISTFSSKLLSFVMAPLFSYWFETQEMNGIKELLDTPGILWPKFDDPEVGKRLAFTGAIKDDVLDIEELACYLMEYLGRHYTSVLEERYKIAVEPEDSGYDLLEKAGRKRGFLMRGAQVDTERMARILLDEFRGGKLGRFTLETVEDAT